MTHEYDHLYQEVEQEEEEEEDKILRDYFKDIYYDRVFPASYSGIEKLWNYIKVDKDRPESVTKEKLIRWLRKQETYQVHTRPPKKYPTEAIIVEGLDEIWDADILHLPTEKPSLNKNYKYLLGVIDLFSRFVWGRLLKSKGGAETARAFQDILAEAAGAGRKCTEVRTDSGGEFTGKEFRQVLLAEKIRHIIAYGEVKANYIERWNRTFQDKLYRWMYEKNTSVFADAVDDIITSYNNTIHGSTGFKPADVTEANAMELYERVYIPILDKRAKETTEFSFRVGQLVRLSLLINKFKRGYTQNYTEEVFKVTATIPSHPPRYKIEDLKGEEVKGSFYKEDLKAVNAESTAGVNWKIDKVIYTRKIKGRKLSLVSWVGFPKKFNTLIPHSHLAKYPRRK